MTLPTGHENDDTTRYASYVRRPADVTFLHTLHVDRASGAVYGDGALRAPSVPSSVRLCTVKKASLAGRPAMQ